MSSTEPVYLTVVLTAKEGKIEQVIEAFKALSDEVYRTEPNVLGYFCFRTTNSQGLDQIVFVEKYANEEAQASHVASPHFQKFNSQFLEQTQGLLAEPLDIKVGSFVAGFEHRNT